MNRINQLGENIWTLRLPFSMSGFHLGTKTTIIRSENELLLHSPGPLQNHLDEIKALGKVTALVAPNMMHHLFLKKAMVHFPEAEVHIAPGLSGKRPDLPANSVLPVDLSKWGLEQRLMNGMPKLQETAFFHRESGTLILTDLSFNFKEHSDFLTRMMLKFNGAYGKFGPTRLLKSVFLSDPDALREDLQAVLKWPIEKIVVAHGENLEGDGNRALSEAYSWLLSA
jgi:hypothetical protein